MKTLTFAEAERDTYRLILQGIYNTSRPIRAQEVRILARIQDKFDAIGVPPKDGEVTFALGPDGGSVALEDAEFAFFVSCMDEVPWLPGAARKASAVYDFIDGARSQ